MDKSQAIVILLLVGVLGIQDVEGSYLKVKYFGGHTSGCVEPVAGFANSKGYEVSIAEFTKHGKVCLPGSHTLHPSLEHENIVFLDGYGRKSQIKLFTGVTEYFKVTVMHNKEENEWTMAVGNEFQMIVRDCALMVIYHTEGSDKKSDLTLGMAPYGTFTLPYHGLPCCGSACLKHTCALEKGFSKGLKSNAYPKPDYGCSKQQSYQMQLPSPSFWGNIRNEDRSPTSQCQTDLNICMVGEQWPSVPLNTWYATGCFGSHLTGEVRLPATPAHGCSSHGRQRSYQVCIEHDDFVRITIGDKLFEYQGDFGPTKELAPYKSCRYFSFYGEPKGNMWLPIQVWYSGSGLNRYSHLSVSILPLQKCVSDHYEEKKIFCKPCTNGKGSDCCEPLGPCDLRYYGQCSSSTKTDHTDYKSNQVLPILPKVYHSAPLPQAKITKIPTRASCLVGGEGSCATAIAGKGFSDGKDFRLVKKDAVLMCCKSFSSNKHETYSWRPSPVEWKVTTVEYNGVETPWISLDKGEGKVDFDDYRKPICSDAVLKFSYHTEELAPGNYVATIHIASRNAGDGEWENENDDPIEIHLLVIQTPKVDLKSVRLNRDKDGVNFAASIDTLNNKLFIDKDNIRLTTEGGIYEQAGALTEFYPYNEHLVTKGSFPVKDPFDCQENFFRFSAVGQLYQHHNECGAVHFTEEVKYCYPPTCRFYATDASYSGGEGLVTDKNFAEFLLICTQQPKICRDCITVHGPDKWRILNFAKLKDSASSFFVKFDWDPRYYGSIHMGVTNAVNYNKGCSLELTKTYECGNTQFTKVTNVEGIEIKRVEEVAVHPLSFKINYDCDGEKCARSHYIPKKTIAAPKNFHAQPTYTSKHDAIPAHYTDDTHGGYDHLEYHDHDDHSSYHSKRLVKHDIDYLNIFKSHVDTPQYTSHSSSHDHWGILARPDAHSKGHY